MDEIKWKDDYNVGCDFIDNAHKKLFSVIRRADSITQNNEYNKDKFACVEAIKFLQNYTLTHFKQEEGFMRKQGYAGYIFHKKLHDELRDETLPELIGELERNDYDRESVMKFLSFFAGWLTGHILVEDRAITGKAISQWSYESTGSVESQIDAQVRRILREFAGDRGVVLLDDSNSADAENAFFYEIDYSGRTLVITGQYSFVKQMAKIILAREPESIDKNVILAYVQLMQKFAKNIMFIVDSTSNEKIKTHRMISRDEFRKLLAENEEAYSMKWHTSYGLYGLDILS